MQPVFYVPYSGLLEERTGCSDCVTVVVVAFFVLFFYLFVFLSIDHFAMAPLLSVSLASGLS